MNSGILKTTVTRGFLTKKIWNCFSTEVSQAGKETEEKQCPGAKMERLAQKLRQKTPIGKLDEIEGPHPNQEREPLQPFPGGINPATGEKGGPKGPEPTRYGDWERKGRVTDF